MTSAVFLAFVVLANLAIIRTAPLLRRRERAPHDHQDSSASLTAPPDFSTMLLDCMNSRQTPKEECYGDSEVNNVLSLVGRGDALCMMINSTECMHVSHSTDMHACRHACTLFLAKCFFYGMYENSSMNVIVQMH